MDAVLTSHIASDEPRVLVVDGSKVARKMIEQVLKSELPNAIVMSCETGAQAKEKLEAGVVDLVTMALTLPDMGGFELARYIREHTPQAYIPIIVVSGSVTEMLETRGMSEDVTDYFDKSLGHDALAEFIRGYVQPQSIPGATVLYIEDSRVVAEATRRMLERQQLKVIHVITAEEAFALLTAESLGRLTDQIDVVLTDVTLKGELSGRDVVERIRIDFAYGKRRLPILVMTGDSNRDNQSELLKAGANDLVLKPIAERLLVTKVLFQLRLARMDASRALV